MLNKISKLLILLATIQFANASNETKKESLNISITLNNVNIYDRNHGNISINSNNDNNINININNKLDDVDKAIHFNKSIEIRIHSKRKQIYEYNTQIQNALNYLKNGKSYSDFMKKLENKKNSYITRALAKENGYSIENLRTMKHEEIIETIKNKYEKMSKVDRKNKLEEDLEKIKNKNITNMNTLLQELTKKQNEYRTTINKNMPIIINNLNIINDNKQINVLKEIRNTITNQEYIGQISNKINDLEKPIVDSFRREGEEIEGVNISELGTNSRVEQFILIYNSSLNPILK